MSELETPTMAAFNILIDKHMHAKATTVKPATSCGTVANKQKKLGLAAGLTVVEEENRCMTQRRSSDRSWKEKRFCCPGADHFVNNCSLAKDIKSKKCNFQGHIAAACMSGGNSGAPPKANAMGEQESKDSLLQIEYRLAENDNKYAEARAVGGNNTIHLSQFPWAAAVKTTTILLKKHRL